MKLDNYEIESFTVTLEGRKFSQVYYYPSSVVDLIEEYRDEENISLNDIDNYIDIVLNLVEVCNINSASTECPDYAEKSITYEDLKELLD